MVKSFRPYKLAAVGTRLPKCLHHVSLSYVCHRRAPHFVCRLCLCLTTTVIYIASPAVNVTSSESSFSVILPEPGGVWLGHRLVSLASDVTNHGFSNTMCKTTALYKSEMIVIWLSFYPIQEGRDNWSVDWKWSSMSHWSIGEKVTDLSHLEGACS